jgi:hypothetical protein
MTTLSSTYICPVRGLAGLEPPDPERLGEAAKIAVELGLDQLCFPIPEGPLVSSAQAKIAYLDGMIRALDRLETGPAAWLIAPARRIMGLDWVPPYLIKGSPDPKAPPVFIDGKVRRVRPYQWWQDLSVVEKKFRVFKEIFSALNGHPAIQGWVILDRALEWPRPEAREAEWVFQSYLSEIRDRDEGIPVHLGLGWTELLGPETTLGLVSGRGGIRLSGLDRQSGKLHQVPGLAGELQLAAFLGSLAMWLFEQSLEVEAGWLPAGDSTEEELIYAGCQLGESGVTGLCWPNLADPVPPLLSSPPWNRETGLARAGLLSPSLEPKPWIEALFKAVKNNHPLENPYNFIDIDQKTYLENPGTHLFRLWDHFREFMN